MEPKNELSNKSDTWTIPVDEEGILVLPDELLAHLGWQTGDQLEWIDQEDGSFILMKYDEDKESNQNQPRLIAEVNNGPEKTQDDAGND